VLMGTGSFGESSQRDAPPHKAVASLQAAVFSSSNQRESPPDKPGASQEFSPTRYPRGGADLIEPLVE
jgi:hypothetical protein